MNMLINTNTTQTSTPPWSLQRPMPAFAAVASLLAAVASGAQAGTVVLTGDVTSVFALTNTFPNNAVAGNGTFFANMLGAGNSVAVLSSSGNSFAPTEVNEFYGSLPGVVSALVASWADPAALAGVDLLVAAGPARAFTAQEISTVSSFLAGGGTLYLAGEAAGIAFGPSSNVIINNLLAGVGSGLTLFTTDLDFGTQLATGSQIASQPLNAGVTSFAYGYASEVRGGTVLMRAINGTAFTAFQTMTPVPEPATWALWLLGAAAMGGWARRRA